MQVIAKELLSKLNPQTAKIILMVQVIAFAWKFAMKVLNVFFYIKCFETAYRLKSL